MPYRIAVIVDKGVKFGFSWDKIKTINQTTKVLLIHLGMFVVSIAKKKE